MFCMYTYIHLATKSCPRDTQILQGIEPQDKYVTYLVCMHLPDHAL